MDFEKQQKLTTKQVCTAMNWCRTTLWLKYTKGLFPKPGKRRSGANWWPAEEVSEMHAIYCTDNLISDSIIMSRVTVMEQSRDLAKMVFVQAVNSRVALPIPAVGNSRAN